MAKYFNMMEMCRSYEAEKRGISNLPDIQEAVNLQKLMDDILDPIRLVYGQPIIVSSGYRCPELNEIVKGKADSWHTKGLAADLQTLKSDKYSGKEMLKKLFKTIVGMKDILPFERVLLERDLKGKYWIHIQYDPDWKKDKYSKPRRLIVEDYLSER